MTAMEFAAERGLLIMPTGSRFIVDPPVMDTDADYAVFSDSPFRHAGDLKLDGWEIGGSEVGAGDGGDGWSGFRKGSENLLLTYDAALWLAFTAATTLARMMNLKDKADRVALFQTVDRLWPGTPSNKHYKALQETNALALEDFLS